MDSIGFYFSIFRRRFLVFLVLSTMISAVAVTVAYTLPPAYESQAVLLVESPQIPEELATSTVQTSAFEQLQVVQQRLLTRDNMLAIARKFDVLPDLARMSPDEIVNSMRARTDVGVSNQRRSLAPLMTLTFEAPVARTAAEVLNEYITIILSQDTQYRQGRATETLQFFQQEVEQLSQELDVLGARILEFKQNNSDALPDSLEFRLDQHGVYRDRLIQIDLEIADIQNQHARLVQLYELTGAAASGSGSAVPRLSQEQLQLEELKASLEAALAIYSDRHPQVNMLKARIGKLEAAIASRPQAAPTPADETDVATEAEQQYPPVLVVQLDELNSRRKSLEEQKVLVEAELEDLEKTIARTPEVTIALEELDRKYGTIEAQFKLAEERLSLAQVGDRIETRSRGQRITVVEQPAIPSQPTKPNRVVIAGGGVAFGILAGLAMVVLLEMLNSTARRPEDIIKRLGVTPLTTIPYIQTRGQTIRRRAKRILLVLLILIGVPAAVYAVHMYYLPLDILAEKVMNKLGVRW